MRFFALEDQHLVGKGWCNEFAATTNLKRNESFTRGLPKKMRGFASKRHVRHTSTFMETSIPFHTLIKVAEAEENTNEKVLTFDLPLEVITVTTKQESQKFSSETFDLKPENMCTQTTDPNNKSKLQFQEYCAYCHKSKTSVSICFRKHREDKQRKRNSYS